MNTNDEVELLEAPGRQYLMIDGSGDPNTSQAFTDAVEALFATAYPLKFACKRLRSSPRGARWRASGRRPGRPRALPQEPASAEDPVPLPPATGPPSRAHRRPGLAPVAPGSACSDPVPPAWSPTGP